MLWADHDIALNALGFLTQPHEGRYRVFHGMNVVGEYTLDLLGAFRDGWVKHTLEDGVHMRVVCTDWVEFCAELQEAVRGTRSE